jgi:hypothetical protein
LLDVRKQFNLQKTYVRSSVWWSIANKGNDIVDYEININNSQILVIQVFRIKIIIVSQESVGKNKSCMYKGHTMVGLWTDDTSVLGKIVYEV